MIADNDHQIVSRSRLYREVWEEPVRIVAERYRVSDVALAKVCRRHRIPVPPRGYWAKLRAGQRLGRPRLPRLGAGERDEITIRGALHPPPQLSEETARFVAEAKDAEARIAVPEELVDPHPLVAKAAKSLRAGRSDESGILISRARPRLDIRVSAAALDRALRVMDAAVKALENRCYRVDVDDEGQYSTSAIILDERVFFFLEEKRTQVEHEPTPEERLEAKRWSWKRWPEYDYVPSGTLRLRIAEMDSTGTRTTWSDGKRQRIEDCVNDFLAGLLKAAEAIKRRRAERLEWERQRREEEKRRWELQRLRDLENTRARELMRQADAWEQARRVRAYVERAREAGVVYLPDYLQIKSLPEWLEWASRHAAEVDPFTRREEEGSGKPWD